jgi:hypothetical protein
MSQGLGGPGSVLNWMNVCRVVNKDQTAGLGYSLLSLRP